MLVSTRRAPVQGIANEARAATVSRTNRNSLQSFASRFSAAVASTSAPKTATSANLGLERSNSASSRKQFLASAGGHRGDDQAGRNLLEIPMDQPPAVAPTANPATAATPKPPVYDGPQDLRDRISDAAGKVTATGAPSVVRLQIPVANQWGYTGEAAHNPYFITPSNPLRDGLVTGFSNWFEANHISGLTTGEMNTNYSATQEGAQEALRLVRQYDPGAAVGNSRFGSGGGPWLADNDTREITLSNGSRLNAGLLLRSYYNQGQGVTARSDQMLQQSIAA